MQTDRQTDRQLAAAATKQRALTIIAGAWPKRKLYGQLKLEKYIFISGQPAGRPERAGRLPVRIN